MKKNLLNQFREVKIHATILLLIVSQNCFSQISLIDSVIQKNSYVINVENEKLTGPAAEFLAKTAKDCQFVALGEEHNVYDIPIFTTALFVLLQQTNGFQYLATEQDPLRSQILSRPEYRGNRDTAFSLLKQFPFSYTFASDQEVNMMADISRLSTGKGRPIWGCDQSFGALHILTALLPFAKSKEARDYTQTYIDSVRLYENDRDNNVHFLSGKCKADDIKRLKQLYSPIIGSYPDWLLHTLEVSQRVYKNYMNGTRNIPGGYYLNGYEREEYMKERIMEEYNYALQMDKELPRVLLKFGQWHVMNGLGPSKLVTTGNFVRALAKINGLQSFYINMKVFNDPALASQASSVLSLFAKNCNINEWTLIDLRPLRWFIDSIKSKKLIQEETILEKFHDFIYTNDALLLFGNGKMGTYKWKENK